MSVVKFKIARGYAPQIKSYQLANPGLTPDEATARWARDKFGTVITDNITQDFTMTVVGASELDIEFTHVLDAQRFVREAGGNIIQGGS